MADEKIAVRIFFKTDGGPVSTGQYRFDPEILKKLRDDFTNHVTMHQKLGGAYDCEVLRQGTPDYVPTVLILRFGDILYIG